MRFTTYSLNGKTGIAVKKDGEWHGRLEGETGYPGELEDVIATGGLAEAGRDLADAPAVDMSRATLLPPVRRPSKIICIGLNYKDHSAESGFEQPSYPTIFARFPSSLIGDGAPIIRPPQSEQLDYEGELVAVVGRAARNVSEADALNYVAGYSVFNDGSIRDYQFKSPQWTAGKNFDDTGAFGPEFVTSDELPPGCEGLQLTVRLNGQVMQSASISDMVFPVARLVSILSEFMTLEPGDLIVTGTPSGVGLARKPPVFMKDGDVCEVEIEGVGLLRNPVKDAAA